jgi:hypothetical protein
VQTCGNADGQLEESVALITAQLEDARRQIGYANYGHRLPQGPLSPGTKSLADLQAENAYLRDENADLRRQLYRYAGTYGHVEDVKPDGYNPYGQPMTSPREGSSRVSFINTVLTLGRAGKAVPTRQPSRGRPLLARLSQSRHVCIFATTSQRIPLHGLGHGLSQRPASHATARTADGPLPSFTIRRAHVYIITQRPSIAGRRAASASAAQPAARWHAIRRRHVRSGARQARGRARMGIRGESCCVISALQCGAGRALGSRRHMRWHGGTGLFFGMTRRMGSCYHISGITLPTRHHSMLLTRSAPAFDPVRHDNHWKYECRPRKQIVPRANPQQGGPPPFQGSVYPVAYGDGPAGEEWRPQEERL